MSLESVFYRCSRLYRELQILSVLGELSNTSQARIAAHCGITPTIVHQRVHELKIRGLIDIRGPSDKKLIYVLTKLGREHLESLTAKYFGVLTSFVAETHLRISRAVDQARSDGFKNLAVLADPSTFFLVAAIAQGMSMHVRPLRRVEIASGDLESGPESEAEAVLVAGNHMESTMTAVVAALDARAVPYYLVGSTTPHDKTLRRRKETASGKEPHETEKVQGMG